MHPTDPITYWIGASQITSPYTFPGGPTTVTVQAQDACGNINTTCSFVVTVRAYSDFAVSVEIQGLTASVTRCVKFTFVDCPSGTPVVLTKDMSFVGGVATTTFTGGTLTCATLANGANVEVEGTTQADLSLTATSVELH